jgi:hypothetical protein
MTSPQILQPAGAGLPFFEIMLLRPAFKLKCFASSQEAASKEFRSEADKILQIVQETEAEKRAIPFLIKRVTGIEDSSRNWSIYMVLDHLRIVDDGVARFVEILTNGGAVERKTRIQDIKPDRHAGTETIERFTDAVQRYERTISRLGKLGRSARHAHPWFGPLNAHEWHCLAGVHQGIHRQQIERIRQGLASVANRGNEIEGTPLQ